MASQSVEPPFALLDAASTPAENLGRLTQHEVPAHLGHHHVAAESYRPSPALLDAINAALTVGAPLLIVGEPGTGKTQAAYYAARLLGLSQQNGGFYKIDVNSETTVRDLFYEFESVNYFYEAQVQVTLIHNDGRAKLRSLKSSEEATPLVLPKLDKGKFIQPRAFAMAFQRSREGAQTVILLDEIDKAPRDLPNDLLNTLDQFSFRISELDLEIKADPKHPPLVVITSNREKRLPEPFLRRCIYHYIDLTPEDIAAIVELRADGFPRLDRETRAEALHRFLTLRERSLDKPPSTGELLVWLTVLSARGATKATLDRARVELKDLPALSCLVKDHNDLQRLGETSDRHR